MDEPTVEAERGVGWWKEGGVEIKRWTEGTVRLLRASKYCKYSVRYESVQTRQCSEKTTQIRNQLGAVLLRST